MIIYNSTKNVHIAKECKVADNFINRFLGLMGKDYLPQDSGLLIKPCNSVHMFFMKFPLDIVFINAENSIVHLINGIKPWHVSRIVTKASCVLELPAGTISNTGTSLGDKLEFK